MVAVLQLHAKSVTKVTATPYSSLKNLRGDNWQDGRRMGTWAFPLRAEQVANELLYGYLTHYAIGVRLALPFMLGWALLAGEASSSVWTLVYGIFTTGASWFFVYPCIGFGLFGLRFPEGIKSTISSLANHLFFGIGMAVGILFV